MKKVLFYLAEYKKECVLSPLFKLLEAFMDLLVPIVVARIINIGVANNDRPYIYRMIGVLVLLASMGLAFSFVAQYFAAKASVGAATKMRKALFDHSLKLSISQFDTVGGSTIITRLTSDINQIQTGINMALRLVLRSPFIVFGSMIMAFTINFHAALVFAVAIPILSVVVYGIMILSIPLFRKVQGKLDKVLKITRENLTGVRVIRAFCREEDEIRDFDEKNEDLTKMNLFVGRLSAVMNPATFVLINIATIVLVYVGGLEVNGGSIKVGDVVALYNYMAQMIVELVKLASLIITINKAVACAGRVSDVLNMDPGMEYKKETSGETKNDPSMSVCFENVSFAYSGSGEEALTDIHFEVRRGETIGIIGGTGSGKTTLVNLIPRFYDVTKGKILVDGRDVRDYKEGELIRIIGMVPQTAKLFEGTIRDNLRWGREEASDEEIWKALETAKATEVAMGKGGLDFVLEQNGRNLSGGQRQRLSIARALVKRPEILILDDSFSALDFATASALGRALGNLGKECAKEGKPLTTFLVSQRCSSIRFADRIFVLSDGQMVGEGTHEELLKTSEIYQEIYYSQNPDEGKEARA